MGDDKPEIKGLWEETLASTSASSKSLLECQKLKNFQCRVTDANKRLKSGKRRGEEHRLGLDDIKRRKLSEIGKPSIFSSSKSIPI